MLTNYGVTVADAALGMQSFSNILTGRTTYHFDEKRDQYLRVNSDGTRQWIDWAWGKSSVPLFRRKK